MMPADTALSVGSEPTVFVGDLSAPDPIPDEGIEAAVSLMRDGRLFRYGEDRDSIPEATYLSSRIVVMSPRPGRIIDIIDCNLPPDRGLDIRETPEFLAIAHRVREGLRAGHDE